MNANAAKAKGDYLHGKARKGLVLIDWGKSISLIEDKLAKYNDSKKLKREQLRRAHEDLLREMVYLYSRSIIKYQIHSTLKPGTDELPPLYTNNEQLAGRLGVDPRTIRNLRKRLVASGLTRERFRGSNTSYAVWISPQVLHAHLSGNPTNIAYTFDPALPPTMRTPPAPFSDPMRKSFPHTVSRDTSQGTKELSKLSGAFQQQSADAQGDMPSEAVENAGTAVENPTSPVEKRQSESDSSGDTFSGNRTGGEHTSSGDTPPSCAAPPQEAPDTVKEATPHLSRRQRQRIELHVQTIWSVASSSLYWSWYLEDAEVERAKARIAEYLAYGKPERWGAGASEIIERIGLVRGYLERRQKAGKKAWVPIPSLYFDIRNDRGFRNTKAWYKKHREAQHEIHNRVQLTKAIRQYTKCLEPGSSVGPAEAYRRISQRLGKRSKALAAEFDRQIAELCQQGQEAA